MSVTEEARPLLEPAARTEEGPGLTLRRAMIIPCLGLYFFALGIVLYVPTEYIQNYFKQKENMSDDLQNPCKANKSEPRYKSYTHTQSQAALWINYYTIACNVPALFTTLLWSSYSDVVGRKFLFILCSSGNAIKLIIITIAIYMEASLVFFVIANIVDGLTGSYMAMFAALFSYVADITKTGGNRTIYIVLFELLMGVSVTISTFATGFFIKSYGFFYPMILCVSLTLLSILLMAVLLPETMSNIQPGSRRGLLKNLKTAVNLYINPGSKQRRVKYILLMVSFLFLAIPSLNRGTLETLYQLGQPFCWSPTKIGYFGTIKIGLLSFMGLLGVMVLRKCFADDGIAAISAAIGVASFIVEGFAKTDVVLYIVPVISSLSMVPIPMIRSLMSHLTPSDKQGALFASIAMVETLCSLIGSLTNNLVYVATVSIMNGFVFFLLALITAVGLVVMLVFMCVSRRYKHNEEMEKILENPPVT